MILSLYLGIPLNCCLGLGAKVEVLKKDEFFAKQLSARGGEVSCQLIGERVEIRGEAVKYLEGVVEV